MKRFFAGLMFSALVGSCGLVAQADTVLYEQNFETDDTANWTVNTGPTDGTADFFYDYSAIGVPNAPGGGTRGLKLTANNATGVFAGINASPTGQNFTGSYHVAFNVWQYYVGPLGAGGSGTTQMSTYGIGTAGGANFLAGTAMESVVFANTLDGGSAVDYRAYSSAAVAGYLDASGVFAAGVAAGVRNNSNAYYAGSTPVSAPAGQLGTFPGQTGATDAGEIAFAWRNVTIDVDSVANTATWAIDGLTIATVNLTGVTLGGGNILFGHHDTNAGISADPNASLLNVTLIDNIRVTAVPEPSALGLGLLGSSLAFIRRRRR